MADPITMAVVTMGFAALEAAGSIMQGEQQADIANANARFARQDATAEAAAARRQNRRILGASRAAIGASGVTVQGSPLAILADNAREGALQEGDILRKGINRSRIFKYEGKVARQQGYLGAGTALLRGGFGAASGFNFGAPSSPGSLPAGGVHGPLLG